MKLLIDIPKEFEKDFVGGDGVVYPKGKFGEFFKRVAGDLRYGVNHGELLCGRYEFEILGMMKKAFNNAEIIDENSQICRWIPVKTRPMTDEEKEYCSCYDLDFIYDCPLPEDGQTVLITDNFSDVDYDTFCRDGINCYFEL